MEIVTPLADDAVMEILMNLAAGVAGVIFTLIGVYSIASIWSDELP